jgi:hypothetical protein
MKMSRELLWGVLLSCVLVVFIMVEGSQPPGVHRAFWESWGTSLFGTVAIIGIGIASYRVLWKYIGFWILLTGLAVLQFCCMTFIARTIAEGMSKIQANIYFGIGSGIVFGIFALMMWRIYEVSPNTSYF